VAELNKRDTVLAWDTSTENFTAALLHRGRIWRTSTRSVFRHSDRMFSALESLVHARGLQLDDVDAFAVGTGPGSFTGLRVGVMAAKTLAFVLRKKLMGFSSLQLIALNVAHLNEPVCVLRDAGRGNVYMAVFAQGRMIDAPALRSASDIHSHLDHVSKFTGDALVRYGKDIMRLYGKKALLSDRRLWRPRASRMIPLALERLRFRRTDDSLELLPDYLYARDCNVTRARDRRR